MKKNFVTGSGRTVILTDDPGEAKKLLVALPVIGICSPGREESWSGINFTAESFEAVDDEYAELACDRYYRTPRTIIDGTEWRVREACMADLEDFISLYSDDECGRFITPPISCDSKKDTEAEWREWLSSFIECEYQADAPTLWVIADSNDRMLGITGLEWKNARRDICAGWYLGYALKRAARHKKLAAEAASRLIAYSIEHWGLSPICLECESDNIASAVTAVRCGFALVQLADTDGRLLSGPEHVVEHALDDLLGVGPGKLLVFLGE